MPIQLTHAARPPAEAEVLGVPVFAGGEPASAAAELDPAFLEARGFDGKVGQVLPLLADDGTTIVAVGVGPRERLDARALRRAAGCFARGTGKAKTAATTLVDAAAAAGIDVGHAAQAVAEGIVLGSYRFVTHKSGDSGRTLESVVITGGGKAAEKGVERGRLVAEAQAMARDLVNTPAGEKYPERLAEAAREIAERAGLSVRVFEEAEIAAEGMGALAGVGQGSVNPPRMIELVHEPKGRVRATVALVGKGITFDSGGLSLKSGDGMMTMKTDMSGAAAVLAAMSVAPVVAPDVRVVGIVPAAENMPSGSAIRPGDVLTARDGTTIEVLNTDAEGRLVLADGLCLAGDHEPDAIVDIATLTGAAVVALGKSVAGLMGNDDELVARVEEAAGRAGEPVWHLPLPEQYEDHLKSEVADLKNIGSPGQAGTLVAGIFLKRFAGERAWAHLDIAGPSRAEGDDGEIVKGGTAFGTRTLVELVASYQARPARGGARKKA